jgi:hypothetical protein
MEKKPDQPIRPEELRARLQTLEGELSDLKLRAQKYDDFRQELENLRQKYADDLYEERKQVAHWHEQALRWQQDYEQLRIQKGGFGFHTLSTVVVVVIILTAVTTYGFLKWTDGRKHAEEAFRREQLFKIEYALSHGQYEQARDILQRSLQNPEYELAHPQIHMIQEVVLAAEKGR